MNIFYIRLFNLLILGHLFFSCKNNNDFEQKAAANIDGQPIYYADIDKIVKQELYDQLSRIYIIRKTALTATINNRLLEEEAIKRNITSEELVNEYYSSHYSSDLLNEFIKNNGLQSGVIELTRGINNYDIESEQGKKILEREFRHYLKQQLIDSLSRVYKIEIFLKPPINPVIQVDKLRNYYRGNLKSNVTLLVISDYECSVCRNSTEVLSDLYEKYKHKVRFAFTNFSSYVTLSALASESAGRQNKFWEFHDSIFNRPELPDTQYIFNLAEKLSLDLSKFKKDFFDPELKDSIMDNFKLLDNYGIFATPTFLINNKLVFNSKSTEEIESLLLQEMESGK